MATGWGSVLACAGCSRGAEQSLRILRDRVPPAYEVLPGIVTRHRSGRRTDRLLTWLS